MLLLVCFLIACANFQYGSEFHGLIEREFAERMLLEAGEGAFLVRASKRSPDAATLCMVFDNHVLNYKLYYDGFHYVGEKRFLVFYLLLSIKDYVSSV